MDKSNLPCALLILALGLALSPATISQALELPPRLSGVADSGSRGSGRGLNAEQKRPLIYIYPENISKPHDFLTDMDPWGSKAQSCFYGLDYWWPIMLRKSPYVTDDPSKADYFMFPCMLYFGKNKDMNKMISVMKAFGPWFDRREGADHIWYIADDYGGCAYSGALPEKSIVMHHWGRVYDVAEPAPCKIFEEWADKCETHIRMVEEYSDNPPPPCHKPYQYIVVPPMNLYEHTHPVDPKYGILNATRNIDKRPNMFFLAGGIHIHRNGTESHDPDHPESDTLYSMGVRQLAERMFSKLPGWIFNEGHIDDYQGTIMGTKFCLAPAGWGWGGRMKAAVVNGCVPVIVQPNIKVEWEEQLPMFEYGIRVPMYMMYKLPEILEVLVRKGIYQKMVEAMQCVWRFHFWKPPHGRAFDLVMCELKARLSNSRISLNTTTCMLKCGQDAPEIDMFTAPRYSV